MDTTEVRKAVSKAIDPTIGDVGSFWLACYLLACMSVVDRCAYRLSEDDLDGSTVAAATAAAVAGGWPAAPAAAVLAWACLTRSSLAAAAAVVAEVAVGG